jgi:thioredoxin 1
MGNKTFEVGSDNFQDEVLNADLPVLIDFWATWCGPCRRIAPIVERIAENYEGKLLVGKLDADQHQDILMNYKIMSIPTLILFKNGEPVVRITGARAEPYIIEQIEPHFS